jgi:HEAT repeat protein
VDVKGIVQKILAGDAALVLEGLGAARDAGAAAAPAAPAIEDLLRHGATVPVAKAALEALGAIGQGSSSAAIRPYSRHRTPELRRQAVKALLSTKGAEAISAFEEGLRSGDGVVRGYSASGLGNLGAKEALPDLFAALDRDVTEAAPAIGQLCDPADCKRFVDRLGKVSFEVTTSGLDPILFRAQALPDDLLLDIVRKLRALGTLEAGRYLADVQARWPASGSAAVKEAIDAASPAILETRP